MPESKTPMPNTRNYRALLVVVALAIVGVVVYFAIHQAQPQNLTPVEREIKEGRASYEKSGWNQDLAPYTGKTTAAAVGSVAVIEENDETLNSWYEQLTKSGQQVETQWTAKETANDARWLVTCSFINKKTGKTLKSGTWLLRLPLTRRPTKTEIKAFSGVGAHLSSPHNTGARELSRLPKDAISQAKNIAVLIEPIHIQATKDAVELEGFVADPHFFIQFAGQIDMPLAVGQSSIRTKPGKIIRLRISPDTPIRKLVANRNKTFRQTIWNWEAAAKAAKQHKFGLLRIAWTRASAPERLDGQNSITNPNGVIAYFQRPNV